MTRTAKCEGAESIRISSAWAMCELGYSLASVVIPQAALGHPLLTVQRWGSHAVQEEALKSS